MRVHLQRRLPRESRSKVVSGEQVLSVGKQFDSAACSGGLGVNTQHLYLARWWRGSRVVSVLDSGAEGPGFKSLSRRCRVTVLGKLFTPIVPLFTKQQNRGSSPFKGFGGNYRPGGK